MQRNEKELDTPNGSNYKPIKTKPMKKTHHCKTCNKLLFYSDEKKESRIIEIKCNKCKTINIIKI